MGLKEILGKIVPLLFDIHNWDCWRTNYFWVHDGNCIEICSIGLEQSYMIIHIWTRCKKRVGFFFFFFFGRNSDPSYLIRSYIYKSLDTTDWIKIILTAYLFNLRVRGEFNFDGWNINTFLILILPCSHGLLPE